MKQQTNNCFTFYTIVIEPFYSVAGLKSGTKTQVEKKSLCSFFDSSSCFRSMWTLCPVSNNRADHMTPVLVATQSKCLTAHLTAIVCSHNGGFAAVSNTLTSKLNNAKYTIMIYNKARKWMKPLFLQETVLVFIILSSMLDANTAEAKHQDRLLHTF